MRKTLLVDGIETNYWIDSTGYIINKKTGKVLTIRPDGTVQVYVNKRSKRRTYSYLAASNFLDNPNCYHLTTYIDGNKQNRDISNIKWINDQENSNNSANTRKQTHNYKIVGIQENIVDSNYTKICDIPPQPPLEFKEFNSNIKVGNDGSIYKNNCRIIPTIGNHNYQMIVIEGKRYLVHILVWKLFGNQEYDYKKVINHINGNKSDNRICNLEQITPAANTQHAIHELHHGNGKYVGEYDDTGRLLKKYDNASDAARAIGILPGSMRNTIRRGGKCYNGLTYKYLE